jgi:hypothetical protein
MTYLIFPNWSGVCSLNRPTHGHPTTGQRFFATAKQLADQYGEEHIVSMVDELVLLDAGPTSETADAIRHSIRP